jgi:hypothetical protein
MVIMTTSTAEIPAARDLIALSSVAGTSAKRFLNRFNTGGAATV